MGLTKEGIKYVFHHDIFRAAGAPGPDGSPGTEQLCFRGKVELVCIVNGRLGVSEDYDRAFAQFVSQ